MRTHAPSPTDATRVPDSAREQRTRHPRRKIAVGVVVLLVVAGVLLVTVKPFGGTGRAKAGVLDNGYPISLATVAEQSLSSQTDVNGTLGYAGSYSVVNQSQGIVTALPSVGQVINQGQVLFEVAGNPVVLLYGSTPSYRSLSEGASASDVTGPDVRELNADLVALGYATTSEIAPNSDEFSWWTKDALERLQAHLGVAQTGTLALGQAVFLPTAARILTVSATLGAPAQPGAPVLTASSTTRQVSIALDAAQQSEVKIGDQVSITLPNNETTPGTVSSVGSVATAPAGGGDPTVTVGVTPTNPSATGSLDQAPVEVAITTANVQHALVVPVDALLALANGGYAIEEVASDGVHHLVPVTLGLFDDADGLVQLTGSGLAAGQRVVVPTI